ncbi:hypothetical protein BDR03DRAFT_3233 [Suillus americanus]|nr:hypothetical protein BDR03DRAFT_3233 [Suillus americanus]
MQRRLNCNLDNPSCISLVSSFGHAKLHSYWRLDTAGAIVYFARLGNAPGSVVPIWMQVLGDSTPSGHCFVETRDRSSQEDLTSLLLREAKTTVQTTELYLRSARRLFVDGTFIGQCTHPGITLEMYLPSTRRAKIRPYRELKLHTRGILRAFI